MNLTNKQVKASLQTLIADYKFALHQIELENSIEPFSDYRLFETKAYKQYLLFADKIDTIFQFLKESCSQRLKENFYAAKILLNNYYKSFVLKHKQIDLHELVRPDYEKDVQLAERSLQPIDLESEVSQLEQYVFIKPLNEPGYGLLPNGYY